jgi:hypothetical protein
MAESDSQQATSIQARPGAAETADTSPGRSVQEGDPALASRNRGASVALWLMLFTFFVFLAQLAIELIIGLLR